MSKKAAERTALGMKRQTASRKKAEVESTKRKADESTEPYIDQAEPVKSESSEPIADSTCISPNEAVTLSQSTITQPHRSTKVMDITLVKSNAPRKSDRLVIFNLEGRTGSVQFLKTLFGSSVPATLTLSGEFAEPKIKVAKVAETKEERKARLAAVLKPTLAERVARAEERTAKLKAKLQASTTKAPELVGASM